MDEHQTRTALREQAGLRVGPQTARYVADQIATGTSGPLAVLAQDARTGVPVQANLAVAALRRSAVEIG